jgi:hypothetical protein
VLRHEFVLDLSPQFEDIHFAVAQAEKLADQTKVMGRKNKVVLSLERSTTVVSFNVAT